MPANTWMIQFEDLPDADEAFTGPDAEAEARERFAIHQQNGLTVTLWRSVDPAAPTVGEVACECPTRNALRETTCWHCRVKYGDTPPTYASGMPCPSCEDQRAALAAPCPCAGMREQLEAEPSLEAWRELIRWAYSNDSDGARRLQEITAHYNQLRAEVDRLHLTINAGRDADEKMRGEREALLFRVKNHEELLDCIGERLGVANSVERFAGDDLDNAVAALVAERDQLRAQLAAETERADMNWKSLERVKGKFEDATAQRAASEERKRALGEQLEYDRTAVAEARTGALKAINSREWLAGDVRGSYEWDDDRYRSEFGAAITEIRGALDPLMKIAADWTGCPRAAEEVAQARIDLKRRAESAEERERALREVLAEVRSIIAPIGCNNNDADDGSDDCTNVEDCLMHSVLAVIDALATPEGDQMSALYVEQSGDGAHREGGSAPLALGPADDGGEIAGELFDSALVRFRQISLGVANDALIAWAHKMGPLHRGNQDSKCFGLYHRDELVGVATMSTLISPQAAGGILTRENCCELSRLCASRSGLCRVVLRLWREFAFASFGFQYAVSYQDADLHNGNTYRFDGWQRLAYSRSGTDTRSGRPGRNKWLWVWPPIPSSRPSASGAPPHMETRPAIDCSTNNGNIRRATPEGTK